MRKENNGYRPFKNIVKILEIFNLLLMIGAGAYVIIIIAALFMGQGGSYTIYLLIGIPVFAVALLLMKCALYFFDGCDYYAEEYLKYMRGRNNNDLLKK